MRSLILAAALAAAAAQPPASAPKVILFVLVDDLGWGDVGFHGSQEIPTPTMDSLVAEGVELTRHHVYKMCTPSRSSFFSGRLPVHVQQELQNPEVQNAGMPRNMTAVGAKMKQAGYHTAVVGKWDIGMATPDHTPAGRGFDESLIYFEHKVDYWTQTLAQSACEPYNPIADLWSNTGPAVGMNGTQYIEYMFRDRVVDIINRVAVGEKGEGGQAQGEPLFLVYTPHVAHCPLMVPPDYLAKFNLSMDEGNCNQGDQINYTPYVYPGQPANFQYRCRSQYAAMVNLLDDVLGNITGLLKSTGLWEDTLMILSSDNGAPLDTEESGASSYPLRGGKYSDFEGGVRATAFASGGYLPPAVRGTVQPGLMHIADWYGTFCKMAGVDPTDSKAAAAGLPPVDSLDLWPVLSGASPTSPRTELPISAQTLIQGQWKFMQGKMDYATWQGVSYPNTTTLTHPEAGTILQCGASGCLFDVVNDPTEHNNVAAQHPDIAQAMAARLAALAQGFYTNNDTGVNVAQCNGVTDMPCACYMALNHWGGFFGPYQY